MRGFFVAEYNNEMINEALKAFGVAMEKLLNKFVKFSEAFEKLAWSAYDKAGYPYGCNIAGLDLWLEEIARYNSDLEKRRN